MGTLHTICHIHPSRVGDAVGVADAAISNSGEYRGQALRMRRAGHEQRKRSGGEKERG